MIFSNIGHLRHFETQIKFFAIVDKKREEIVIFSFLSDPSPIIGNACQ